MKIVSKTDTPKERKTIDYDQLADYYNRCELGEAVELPKVYNVTLFRKSLNLRGITAGTDFVVFTQGNTYIQRLTHQRMSSEPPMAAL